MEKVKMPIPLFEVYISFLSILLALILLSDHSFLDEGSTVYSNMAAIANQIVWSIVFSVAAFIKIIGLIFKKNGFRKVGLVVSFAVHALLGYCYYVGDGYIGACAFILIALFSLFSIFEVDTTELR